MRLKTAILSLLLITFTATAHAAIQRVIQSPPVTQTAAGYYDPAVTPYFSVDTPSITLDPFNGQAVVLVAVAKQPSQTITMARYWSPFPATGYDMTPRVVTPDLAIYEYEVQPGFGFSTAAVFVSLDSNGKYAAVSAVLLGTGAAPFEDSASTISGSQVITITTGPVTVTHGAVWAAQVTEGPWDDSPVGSWASPVAAGWKAGTSGGGPGANRTIREGFVEDVTAFNGGITFAGYRKRASTLAVVTYSSNP